MNRKRPRRHHRRKKSEEDPIRKSTNSFVGRKIWEGAFSSINHSKLFPKRIYPLASLALLARKSLSFNTSLMPMPFEIIQSHIVVTQPHTISYPPGSSASVSISPACFCASSSPSMGIRITSSHVCRERRMGIIQCQRKMKIGRYRRFEKSLSTQLSDRERHAVGYRFLFVGSDVRGVLPWNTSSDR